MPSVRCVFVFHTITCYFCDSRMSKLWDSYSSVSCKYIGFGLNVTERISSSIVDKISST